MSEDDRKAQRDAEQAVLDEEMRKRRERVKAWQEAKAKALAEEAATIVSSAATAEAAPTGDTANAAPVARADEARADQEQWTLEDDDDDDVPDTDTPAADTAGLDALPPLAPLREIPALTGDVEGDEAEGDDAVFASVGSIQSRAARRQSGIAVSLASGQGMPPPSLAKSVIASPVAISLSQAQEASAALARPTAVPVIKLATSSAPNVGKKNRFAAAKASVSDAREVNPDEAAMDIETPAPSDDYDPLDAYMTDLYGGGDVATQDMVAVVKPAPLRTKASSVSIDNDSDESSDSDVNPFGSNFITLDQIMGTNVMEATKATSGKGKSSRSGALERAVSGGWESDSAVSQLNEDETPEEREAREEAERQEFIMAIKKARELEEEEEKRREEEEAEKIRMVEQTMAEDLEDANANDKKKTNRDDLGRVFAGEGDVLEDFEVEAKKKSALELLEEQKKAKELKAVDHSQIQYIPFRKNLYIVPKSIAKISEDEANIKRGLLQTKVRGKHCPCPVDTWEQCGLSDKVLGVIEKSGFKSPFAIQKQAIPAIMCGRDVIGVAKTGSGKTLAFLLPMIRHILDQPPLAEAEGPIGLIMAPARELAFQIFNEAKKFCKPLGLRATCVYGGAGIAEQIADLKRGAAIVVCTPGRMIDILTMQAGKLVSFKRVTMVVMDEADRMFDMGFEPQIKMITQNVRPDRQTVLFSATFPKQIEKLAKTILKMPLEIVVGDRSVANKDITQYVEIHDEDEKFLRLLQLLGIWYERGSVLIFVDKQDKCDKLFQDLLKSGYPSLSLHGGKDQIDRDHTLHEFKTLIKTVMVATSVAGRGLDVPEIVCVVNYNCPNHLEDYVHRIGRTGRAGRKGTAYTFISPNEDQYSLLMCKALEQAEQPVPIELQSMADAFKDKVARGEARWAVNQFTVTKGFTFDASEMNDAQKLASQQRRAYEIEQGIINPGDGQDDEGDVGDDYDDDDDGVATAATTTSVASIQPIVTAPVYGFPGAPVAAPTTAVPDGAALLKDLSLQPLTPLERARALAAAMNKPQPPTAPAINLPPPLPSGVSLTPEAALARAKQIAMSMSLDDETDYSKMHFSADFEINDYPPQVNSMFIDSANCDFSSCYFISGSPQSDESTNVGSGLGYDWRGDYIQRVIYTSRAEASTWRRQTVSVH